MNQESQIMTDNSDSRLTHLTRSLLYEGYSLYPYYRSAVKNQMPVPFGVIFPRDYNAFHEHAHSRMQSQCIVAGVANPALTIQVRFLHVRKTQLFEKKTGNDGKDEFVPAAVVAVNDRWLESGWQTIERNIVFECRVTDLINGSKIIPIAFDSCEERELIFNADKIVVAKSTITVAPIQGMVGFSIEKIDNRSDAFKVTTVIINTTSVDHPGAASREVILAQSFLSSHIVLQTNQAGFISHQDPPPQWQAVIATCINVNTWPIIVDDDNEALLSSPIILNDRPEINPLSSGDLFDSTEIEEALLLHVNLLSDDEKKRIGGNDPRLLAMLNKVSSLTPEDLTNYHSMMKEWRPGEFMEQ
jgi:hypothetical protein